MIDTPPSANPMPAEPVATVQNPAAPFPPADSRPVFEPPSVMDPVSNLDFLPVDDAFALEMRAESIEQLVGGDALRRGESERIEAGRSHPAPLPPPSAPGRTGAGAVAPPPGADPWRIRPPRMSGGPDPVAFGPWPAPPGSSTRIVYAETMRTPVMSTGAPPGRQGAETPGFAWVASGAVELPFSRRERIAALFWGEHSVAEAERALLSGRAGTRDWSAMRVLAVLDDLYRLNAIAYWDSAADAAMADVDWRAIEVLFHMIDAPPRS